MANVLRQQPLMKDQYSTDSCHHPLLLLPPSTYPACSRSYRAQRQVLGVLPSTEPFHALRTTSAASAKPSYPPGPSFLPQPNTPQPQATLSINGSFPNNDNYTHMEIQLMASRSRMINNTHAQSHNHRRGKSLMESWTSRPRSSLTTSNSYGYFDTNNGVKAKGSTGQSNPIKASRTHNELHKELLLAHKRGLALSSRSELQQALERRMRVQSDREEEGQNRTPLEDVLLRRQQKQLEGEKEQKEKVQEEAQLMEFVRVRQNLRKIHSAMQSKAANT